VSERHIVTAENAAKFWEWLQTRGGLAIWKSIDLSNPGLSWTTPANAVDGTPTPKPTWKAESTPSRIITDPAEVVVSIDHEVKRFHVAIRRGSQGFSFKLTDASSDRIHKAVAKAGKDSYHLFDYDTQEAVIMEPESQVPLADFMLGPEVPA
jgi:hypothetical protein